MFGAYQCFLKYHRALPTVVLVVSVQNGPTTEMCPGKFNDLLVADERYCMFITMTLEILCGSQTPVTRVALW